MPEPHDHRLSAPKRDDSLGGRAKPLIERRFDSYTSNERETFKRVLAIFSNQTSAIGIVGGAYIPDKDVALVGLPEDLREFDRAIREPIGFASMATTLKYLNQAFLPHARAKGFEGAEATKTPNELAEAYGYLVAPQDGSSTSSRLEQLSALFKEDAPRTHPKNVTAIKALWADLLPKLELIMKHPSNANLIEVYGAWRAVEIRNMPSDPLARALAPSSAW